MFEELHSVDSLDVSGFNASSLQHLYSMFANCKLITKLDLKGFDLARVNSLNSVFSGCENLQYVDFRNANFSNLTSYESTFAGALRTINVVDGSQEVHDFIKGLISSKGTVAIASA